MTEVELPARPAATGPPTIPRRPDGRAPLSFGQERLWFMEQFAPGTAAYVIPVTLRLRGPLDPDLLGRALDAVAARHDSLRMRFTQDVDGLPAVDLAGPVTVPLVTAHAHSAGRARELVADAARQPFDLATAPLLRALLIRLGETDHVLHLAAHHIVTDGWSFDLLLGELATQYAGYLDGRPEPSAPAVRYGDYAAWQRERVDSPAVRGQLDYWRGALADVPPLELPTDRPRPAEQGHEGATHRFTLDAGLTDELRRLGRRHRATLYMTLLAGLQTLLFRQSGQRDFAVGSPVAGRVVPELEHLIGLFINTLALRADLNLDAAAATGAGGSTGSAVEPSFATLLGRTRTTVIRALARQEVPFERLVQELHVPRDVSRAPVFQVMFALQNYARGANRWPAGLVAESFGTGISSARYDLAVYLSEADDGLRGSVLYNTDLFDPQTMTRFTDHYRNLLRAAVARPDLPLVDLDLLDRAERDRVLSFGAPAPARRAAGATTATSDAGTLADLITPYAVSTSTTAAVVCGGDSVTYRELDHRANRIARFLRRRGVGPESLVGVCLEQSVELAVTLLGVLRAGGAYVPLDPEQPPARLAGMLADAGPAIVLTDTTLRAQLAPLTDAPLVCLDLVRDEVAAEPETAPPDGASPDNLAYVIYTSGSTGTPKGVAVAHRQVLRYLNGIADRLDVPPAGRYALLQSMSFDFSVTVFYLALATGGTVHLVPRRCTGAELADELRRHRIDYLKMTPSHLAALAADVPPGALLPHRALLLGGEPADPGWAAGLAEGNTRVVNHYGPTEATVGVTTYRIRATGTGPGPVPIGTPLPYARVHLLDHRLRPVPVGTVGEIYLGGDRLARGYLNQPGQTAGRFVADPFGPPGGRLYRTGDLGRWRGDGELVFLGRRDHQVKLRGYRVELGEVEAALREHDGVVQAAVLLRDDRLVAYLERRSGAVTTEPATLRRTLADRLPEYMIPTRYVWLDRLPLQEHGKVDRGALPPPGDDRPTGTRVAPDGPVETVIAAVWQAVLGIDRIGVTDDFFDLGGHSLLATRVVARLRRELPETVDGPVHPVTVMDLFKHRTVRELAELAELVTGDGGRAGGLLHELTPPVPATTERVRSLVCVPYGGGSAVVYQPLADALPVGHRLYAVAVPGHDIGLADDPRPIPEVARAVADEILATVDGPLALYGHCGPGGALAVEIARLLEAAGRDLDALYLGGVFPFARPVGGVLGPLLRLRLAERIRSDRIYRTWLQAQGADLGALDPDQAAFLIRAMRHDARVAEDYFTALVHQRVAPLRAPIVCVVGDRDRGTEYAEERFREWHFLSDRTALAVVDEGGHYFLKYRAAELAEIVTTVDRRLDRPDPATAGANETPAAHVPAEPDPGWRLTGVSRRTAAETSTMDGASGAGTAPESTRGGAPLPVVADATVPRTPEPSIRRFALVAVGQIVTMTGTALTNFALPLWIYLETGSLARFALFAVLGLVPGLLVAPLAGALIDRTSRRRIILLACCAAGGAKLVIAAALLADLAQVWHFYLLVAWLSVALAFQRLAFVSAVPQLVPKRYLGHANGVTQTATGLTQFMVPLIAVALLEAVDLHGILVIDVVLYGLAIVVLLAIRFPATMALRRRESIGAEITGGLRYSWRRREFRAMLVFFALLNLFLFPALFLLSPLVLGFADLAEVARIALVGGLGGAAGGLVMLVWGGPRHHRMRTVLIGTVLLGLACVVTGLRPDLTVIAAGAFGMYLALGVVNGVYATVVQTKVPQLFHGRVFALNQMVAWSTLPLGWGVIAPLASGWAEPLLQPGGALAPTVGAVIGVGPGRGIGLLYVAFGLCIGLTAVVSLRTRVLARFDDEVPDAPPDDVLGIEARQARAARAGTGPTDRSEREVAGAATGTRHADGS
ncbi:amino acid adenylation domain-containing protein [Micromonospora pisi]|uniref:Amino acid adenylation domain-containing protein n=1 Tax=Micromonospora pisi TaxID=589240 RepID=A0A495JBN6_9ACTN|nr:non-ribosomal peptide synthetase/MFS transporter [Micromonospora pisi]RKR86141.1 amino acid adenylation domain-containing protein [Micromonospora pisi]